MDHVIKWHGLVWTPKPILSVALTHTILRLWCAILHRARIITAVWLAFGECVNGDDYDYYNDQPHTKNNSTVHACNIYCILYIIYCD